MHQKFCFYNSATYKSTFHDWCMKKGTDLQRLLCPTFFSCYIIIFTHTDRLIFVSKKIKLIVSLPPDTVFSFSSHHFTLTYYSNRKLRTPFLPRHPVPACPGYGVRRHDTMTTDAQNHPPCNPKVNSN